jgi:hypothetical protein
MTGKVVYQSGVSQARSWADALLMREIRTPNGDFENAMHRLEARYGIPWRVFWNLRSRTPADVMVGLYRQLQAAYTQECERQERLLAHERHVAEAKVLTAEAVARTPAYVDEQEGI